MHPLDATSFRNTLSSGDRSTLALAFFLAQLDLDPGLPNKIVVFDDPFTSQDRSRRSCTQQFIRRKSAAAAQVIVLSHDPEFLKVLGGIRRRQREDVSVGACGAGHGAQRMGHRGRNPAGLLP